MVAGIILLAERFFSDEPSVFKNMSKNEAALFIDFDNMQRVFAGEIIDEMTVLDVLNASVAVGQIKLVYHVDSSNNTKVTEINDHKANDEKRFAFYVNSRLINPGKLNEIQVHLGDKITIKLE